MGEKQKEVCEEEPSKEFRRNKKKCVMKKPSKEFVRNRKHV
jgi:hypothetical protein